MRQAVNSCGSLDFFHIENRPHDEPDDRIKIDDGRSRNNIAAIAATAAAVVFNVTLY